jgi:hypothetical protein
MQYHSWCKREREVAESVSAKASSLGHWTGPSCRGGASEREMDLPAVCWAGVLERKLTLGQEIVAAVSTVPQLFSDKRYACAVFVAQEVTNSMELRTTREATNYAAT